MSKIKEKQLNGVLALKIVKPLNMDWDELGRMLVEETLKEGVLRVDFVDNFIDAVVEETLKEGVLRGR